MPHVPLSCGASEGRTRLRLLTGALQAFPKRSTDTVMASFALAALAACEPAQRTQRCAPCSPPFRAVRERPGGGRGPRFAELCSNRLIQYAFLQQSGHCWHLSTAV
ncbi:unnamed protein product [Symbiodinium sp. CCMP2592]|nr:unnamed protein product [Symbiodinium sp. CCMP2592]